MANFRTLGRALGKGVPQALSNINTLQQLQARKQEMKILGQEAENEQILFEQEQERLGTSVNINTHPLFMGLSPEGQQRVQGDLFKAGVINDRGIGDIGGLENWVSQVESSAPLFKQYMEGEVVAIENRAIQIGQQIEEERNKPNPNPKRIQDLETQQGATLRNAQTRRGKYEGHLKVLDDRREFQQREKEIRLKGEEARKTVVRKAELRSPDDTQRLGAAERGIKRLIKIHQPAFSDRVMMYAGEDFYRMIKEMPTMLEQLEEELNKTGNEEDQRRWMLYRRIIDDFFGTEGDPLGLF